ncbi:MAG: glutamate racemase [Syntrophomonadaceae bacterium]|nr:glutamate racemase [Syntrophomonadaceae bacterium]
MDSNYPIGVFDTGVGGLSVVSWIFRLLPQERIVYFADRARQPYGALPGPVAEKLVLESLEFLVERGAKALVIACNTATAAGYEAALQQFDIPVIGVIEPGVKSACAVTRNQRVGLIGTNGTIESQAHARIFAELDPAIRVFGQGCPMLPPLIELGKLDTDETALVVEQYLEPLKAAGIDTLVLGCTHFPYVRHIITRILGENVAIVDPAEETAKLLKEVLTRENSLNQNAGDINHQFIVSKYPDTFREVGSLLLGQPLAEVEECLVGQAVEGFEIEEAAMYEPGS